jgi:hypothetical protein
MNLSTSITKIPNPYYGGKKYEYHHSFFAKIVPQIRLIPNFRNSLYPDIELYIDFYDYATSYVTMIDIISYKGLGLAGKANGELFNIRYDKNTKPIF